MKQRPILFSGAMVRAVLAGRKTQTRRAVKPQPPSVEAVRELSGATFGLFTDHTPGDYRVAGPVWAVRDLMGGRDPHWICPYGVPGDRLWVRENGWQPKEPSTREMRNGADTWPRYVYAADHPNIINDAEDYKKWGWTRRPSIHMPRVFSRLTLEITAVRVEQLHTITEADAKAEGFDESREDLPALDGPIGGGLHIKGARAWHSAAGNFLIYWEALNAKRGYGYDTLPWVWCISFTVEQAMTRPQAPRRRGTGTQEWET